MDSTPRNPTCRVHRLHHAGVAGPPVPTCGQELHDVRIGRPQRKKSRYGVMCMVFIKEARNRRVWNNYGWEATGIRCNVPADGICAEIEHGASRLLNVATLSSLRLGSQGTRRIRSTRPARLQGKAASSKQTRNALVDPTHAVATLYIAAQRTYRGTAADVSDPLGKLACLHAKTAYPHDRHC